MHLDKRVLVTGGAGFIGAHLCARLLDAGCEVLCVDNFITSARANVRALLDHPSFEAKRHDVTMPLHVEVDEIYNLACPASPVHYQTDPIQTTKTSVLGALNRLGLAKRLKAPIQRLMWTPAELTGPVNPGNPKEFTIRDLADLVLDLTGSRSPLVRRPLPPDDPRQRRPDIAQAIAGLDWRPRTQLREGLARTIAYFETLLSLGEKPSAAAAAY